MPGSNIFDLGDQFGVSSPFGDWLSESQQARAAEANRRASIASSSAQTASYKRMMFYGGSKNDDDLFGRAADNVNRDYGTKAQKIQITAGGQKIVDKINAQRAGNIQSIDFFAHGNEVSLLFKPDANGFYQELYLNDAEEQSEGNPALSGTDKNKNGADVSEINYSVFTNSAKIEIHGCNAGSITGKYGSTNLASEFSRLLHAAGKTRAVVVGHVDFANPNNHRTLRGDDYRHGVRRIFHGGDILFRTKHEGRITATMINKYLDKKARLGSSYNGANEKTW